jgi:hypothetical protein
MPHVKKNPRLILGILLPNYYPYIQCPQGDALYTDNRKSRGYQCVSRMCYMLDQGGSFSLAQRISFHGKIPVSSHLCYSGVTQLKGIWGCNPLELRNSYYVDASLLWLVHEPVLTG